VKAAFDGTTVRCGQDGLTLYDQAGFGRKEGNGLKLAPQEALYLLQRGKIKIDDYDFDKLLAVFAEQPNIVRSYFVYRDLRERGYAVQTGPHDFRVFKRGQRPGKGESLYFIRVISERDPIQFSSIIKEVNTAHNMRKQYVLATVDDENELTYYEIKLQTPPHLEPFPIFPSINGTIVGKSTIIHVPPKSQFEEAWFGSRLDDNRLLLSPFETIYLAGIGDLSLKIDMRIISVEDLIQRAQETDTEFLHKLKVYEDLRKRGYIPKTGYKFGHHFRVYSGQKPHSEMLVHAIEENAEMPMITISRSVRLAHSVKKKMLFGCVYSTGIQYIEFARIKL
jgi:tRNA-intron endonuclease